MISSLKKTAKTFVALMAGLFVASCVSTPPPQKGEPATKEAEAAPAEPVVAEFADAWDGAEVRIEAGDTRDLEGNRVQVGFRCVWTNGQKVGPVYPERFVSTETGEEVPMEFTWDSGGRITEGVYDAYVEVDARCGDAWLRNLPLRGDNDLEVIIDLNACQFQLPLDTYREVVVYPAGTYEDFAGRNMLDAIPDDLAITWYNSENRGVWAVAPSGTFDLEVSYTDGTTEWLQGYELPANARVTEL